MTNCKGKGRFRLLPYPCNKALSNPVVVSSIARTGDAATIKVSKIVVFVVWVIG